MQVTRGWGYRAHIKSPANQKVIELTLLRPIPWLVTADDAWMDNILRVVLTRETRAGQQVQEVVQIQEEVVGDFALADVEDDLAGVSEDLAEETKANQGRGVVTPGFVQSGEEIHRVLKKSPDIYESEN